MDIFEQLAELKVEEAEEKAKAKLDNVIENFVRRLLANTEFSVDKIASLAGVPVSFVEAIKAN